MKILIVEDTFAAVIALKAMLMKLGLEVEHAKDGPSAVKMATEHEYDFIFMDIGLPVFDGLEAMKRIRSEGVDTPAVALTANLAEYSLDTISAAGMQGGYQKPMTIEVLVEICRKFELISSD